MTFRLTKDEQALRAQHIDALRSAADNVTAAVEEANATIAEAVRAVQDKIAEYNQAVVDANSFADDVASRLTDAYGEKSDKWQQSERGQNASTFADEWANADWSELSDLDVPELEVDAMEHADTLEQLPEEMES